MRARQVPWPIVEHWWLCARKRPYSTRTVAELGLDAAFIALRGRSEPLRVYECPLAIDQGSTHWHWGHAPRPRKPHEVRKSAESAWNRYVDRHPRWGGPRRGMAAAR